MSKYVRLKSRNDLCRVREPISAVNSAASCGSLKKKKKKKRVSSLPPPWLLLTERRSIIPNKTLRRLHDKLFDKPCIMAVAVPTTADYSRSWFLQFILEKRLKANICPCPKTRRPCSATVHRQIDQTWSIIVVYEFLWYAISNSAGYYMCIPNDVKARKNISSNYYNIILYNRWLAIKYSRTRSIEGYFR